MRKNKSGFTLIELMVVAIIVAILAAVAIPMMSGNKDRAMATEGQAGIGAIVTASKTYYTEHGSMPSSRAILFASGHLNEGDLVGKYKFVYSGISSLGYDTTAGMSGSITATGGAGTDADGKTVTLDTSTGTWSGTLME